MRLVEDGRWWIGPNGERCRVIAGSSDVAVEPELFDPPIEEPAPPPAGEPAPPPPPAAEQEAARLREENARLLGENRVLRETRRDPAAPAPPAPPADPHATEFAAIEQQFREGTISDAERTMRLGALGAEATLARREQREREAAATARGEQARQRSSQKIAAYLRRLPGLGHADSPEMQRVRPHLHAVAEEFGLEAEDPRAQALALERTFGPIDRSPHVDTREFERIRHPGGGGGGTFAEEPPQPPTPKSKGQRLWDALTPESQAFFVSMRGSQAAAIKTLEYGDEHQMRKQGRFK